MKRLLLLLSTVFFVAHFSIAQESKDNIENDLYEMSLEELMDISVVSASKSAEKASDAPSTIYAISKDQIATRGYSNLEELLEDIPEIEIQRKSVTEYSNYFTFRGIAGNEKFLILQNGVRIASVTGSPHAITHNYPVMHAERVEVILGPASALYGADAFTGIVNIITKEGTDVNGGTLQASYGNFNTTDNSFVAGGGNNNVSVMASGKFYYSAEPKMFDYYEDEYQWYNVEYSQNGDLIALPDDPDKLDTISSGDPKAYETPTQAYFFNTQVRIKDIQIGFMRNFESHNSSVSGRPEFNVYSKDAQYNVINQVSYLSHDFNSENEKWNIQSTFSHSMYELAPESKFVNTFTGYNDGYKYANSQNLN
jgi:outer membrane cobalamin receptor